MLQMGVSRRGAWFSVGVVIVYDTVIHVPTHVSQKKQLKHANKRVQPQIPKFHTRLVVYNYKLIMVHPHTSKSLMNKQKTHLIVKMHL